MSLPIPTHIERLRAACPITDSHVIRSARRHELRRLIVRDVAIIERKVKP